MQRKSGLEVIRKNFTEAELNEFKSNLASNLIEINKKETAFQELKEQHKEDVAPLKKNQVKLLDRIERKYEDVEMMVIYEPDYENGLMRMIDESTSQVVHERGLLPSERQQAMQFNN